jgi:hypothetical protein
MIAIISLISVFFGMSDPRADALLKSASDRLSHLKELRAVISIQCGDVTLSNPAPELRAGTITMRTNKSMRMDLRQITLPSPETISVGYKGLYSTFVPAYLRPTPQQMSEQAQSIEYLMSVPPRWLTLSIEGNSIIAASSEVVSKVEKDCRNAQDLFGDIPIAVYWVDPAIIERYLRAPFRRRYLGDVRISGMKCGRVRLTLVDRYSRLVFGSGIDSTLDLFINKDGVVVRTVLGSRQHSVTLHEVSFEAGPELRVTTPAPNTHKSTQATTYLPSAYRAFYP